MVPQVDCQDVVRHALKVENKEKDTPPPPPEADLAYKKKGKEGTGAIAMIDPPIGDLEKEITEAKVDENDAQEDYEAYMKDSAEKRVLDSKAFADKEGP